MGSGRQSQIIHQLDSEPNVERARTSSRGSEVRDSSSRTHACQQIGVNGWVKCHRLVPPVDASPAPNCKVAQSMSEHVWKAKKMRTMTKTRLHCGDFMNFAIEGRSRPSRTAVGPS